MYSTNIRNIIKMYNFLLDEMVLEKSQESKIDVCHGAYTIHWDGFELAIISGIKSIKITKNLAPNRVGSKNYISAISSRFNIRFKNIDFLTSIAANHIVKTKDIALDEGLYFQCLMVTDLPAFDEIQDVYDAAKELVENGLSYVGTYKMPQFNLNLLTHGFSIKYPVTKEIWDKFK